MRYISNTPAQQKEMLGLIGVSSIEDLLVRIPAEGGEGKVRGSP
jgi:glycine cleavage system pyridoxal-binding protein P